MSTEVDTLSTLLGLDGPTFENVKDRVTRATAPISRVIFAFIAFQFFDWVELMTLRFAADYYLLTSSDNAAPPFSVLGAISSSVQDMKAKLEEKGINKVKMILFIKFEF